MPARVIAIGSRSEFPFKGINEKTEDIAQDPGWASGGFNFIAEDGVLKHRPGTTWSTDVARPASKYIVMDGSDGMKIPWIAPYDLLVRWTLVIAFRTPASFSANHTLFSKHVTIGSTEYPYPTVYVNSAGRVYVGLTSAAGVDKTFNTGANVLAADTNYVLQVTRYDHEAFVWWGTPTTSPAIKGSTDALGKLDYPVNEAEAGDIALGAKYTGAAYSDPGAFELHQVLLLTKVVNHQDFGFTQYAAPRDPDCALSMIFDDASGHITDLSANENNSDDETGIDTYGATTHAFVSRVRPVNLIQEFTNISRQQRVLLVAGGSVYAANYHI